MVKDLPPEKREAPTPLISNNSFDLAYIPPDFIRDKDVGLLLSDKIKWFVDRGFLIASGFEEHNLKPASYELTLGQRYYQDGKFFDLDPNNPCRRSLTIPANSIVAVSINEKIRLPHYIYARFNLRVEYIYRGLLLGTGPQVDPGFDAYLSCPLHNLTNHDITIKYGESFACIDFGTTTRLGSGNPKEITDQIQSDQRHEGRKYIRGYNGEKCFIYETRRKGIWDNLPRGEIISSSVKPLENKVTEFEKILEDRVRYARWFETGAVIAFIVWSVGVIIGVYTQFNKADREIEELRGRIGQLEKTIESHPSGAQIKRPSGAPEKVSLPRDQ